MVSVIENVTEVKRAELSQRLLARAGEELVSSLDYAETLQRLAHLAVPGLAEWCAVMMCGAGDMLEHVPVAHADPSKVALAREFGERYPARLDDGGGVARVMRSAKAMLIPLITEEMLSRASVADEQRALAEELQMRSVIIAPLAIAGRSPIGALSLVMAESGGGFDEDDLVLAEELGRRAGPRSRTPACTQSDPVAAIQQLNAALRERPQVSLVTVCCALVRQHGTTAEADVVLAGHPPPYRIHAGIPRTVGSLAAFVGAYEDGGWQAVTVSLDTGDQLVLYTDGVTDTVGETERLREHRLAAALRDAEGATDTIHRIERAMTNFAHGPSSTTRRYWRSSACLWRDSCREVCLFGRRSGRTSGRGRPMGHPALRTCLGDQVPRVRFVCITSIAAAAALAGCGSSNIKSSSTAGSSPAASGQTTSSASASASTGTAAPVALVTTKQAKLGTILAYGPKRLTVYLFEADKGARSSCSGKCAKVWPPVIGKPKASGHAMPTDLGTIKRADGTTQVTYKGHPLYLFIKDKDDGDTYGQGINGFGAAWYAVAPSGDKVDNS